MPRQSGPRTPPLHLPPTPPPPLLTPPSRSKIALIPWYSGKATIRSYLAALNTGPTPAKLEYTLFQPGGFLEYLAYPHAPTAHIRPIATQIDVANSRVLVAKGALDAKVTMTSVRDLARAVVAAVEYEGVWPVLGGVRGTTTTTRELVAVVERVTGREVKVEEVDVEGGAVVGASWLPRLDHPSFDGLAEGEREKVAAGFWAAYLRSLEAGAWEVGGEWNEALGWGEGDVQGLEGFLGEWWGEGGRAGKA